jgi:hypothetical protein
MNDNTTLEERLSSVNMSESDTKPTISDIESQSIDIHFLSTERDSEMEELIAENVWYAKQLFICLLYIPIIICDLYYAYNNNSCVNQYSSCHNLKTYLIMSGYVSLVMILSFIIINRILTIINKQKYKKLYTYLQIIQNPIIVLGSFALLIINLIGVITFYGYIYNNDDCDQSFSNYMFVSLILKMISIIIILFKNIMIF